MEKTMANSYTDFSLSFSHTLNPKVKLGSDYNHQDILSLEGFKLANNEITSWDNYKPTPLHSFDDIAKDTGVSSIFYKDENPRFTLKSFKALGGAYAAGTNVIMSRRLVRIPIGFRLRLSGIWSTYHPLSLNVQVLLTINPLYTT
jgi:diaminopropionate ammonia-lyase